ncbi:hypothetical protein [Nodularia sp. NIES-3585]|nr:hypothetical protein [Nodularia sp. NIES-3585]
MERYPVNWSKLQINSQEITVLWSKPDNPRFWGGSQIQAIA